MEGQGLKERGATSAGQQHVFQRTSWCHGLENSSHANILIGFP